MKFNVVIDHVGGKVIGAKVPDYYADLFDRDLIDYVKYLEYKYTVIIPP